MEFQITSMATTMVVAILLGLFWHLYNVMVVKPGRLRSILMKQGITGPSPAFLLGNIKEIKKSRDSGKQRFPSGEAPAIHDCAGLLFPFFKRWREQYGDLFVFSLGNIQILYVNQPDIVREITTYTSLDLGKPLYQQRDRGPLLGNGILSSNGAAWANHRKILAPELYMDKVKGMVDLIVDSTSTLVDSWKSLIEVEGGVVDIKIDEHMMNFSGDVISRACFGSNFSKGQQIFFKLRALLENMANQGLYVGIPGLRHVPTKSHREAWALEKEIRTLILNVVKERREGSYEKDLLQMVLEGARNSNLSDDATNSFIVDNCKNIYLAGYETTATAASWCLMLLASNPGWQARVRDEVLEVCQGQSPNSDMLRKMKELTMVIHESLRLYPPVTVMSREAYKDMKFGDIDVPKGLNVWTFVLPLHTDPEVWGQDAYEFNPERFANGISGACKFPHFYMPFGVGPRVCLGQNLAMVELKILVSLLVSSFTFSISPRYQHAPAQKLVLEPGSGVHLLVKKL